MSLAGLAAELRAGLASAAFTGLDPEARRRELARVLGVAELTPKALMVRLAAAAAPGGLWPALVNVLVPGVTQGPRLDIPGVASWAGDQVIVAPGPVPAEFVIDFSVGPVRPVAGFQAMTVTLRLTIPPDPAASVLVFGVHGLSVGLPGDDLVRMLVPGGLAFQCEVTGRIDATGVAFDGGGRDGVTPRLTSAPPGLSAPSLHLSPRAGGLRVTVAFGAALFGVADAAVHDVGADVTSEGLAPVPPSGAGLRLALGPAKGAGFLENRDGRYAGALALSLGAIDVHAYGIVRTDPFSLLVVISAQFSPPLELGLALTLNAVGGILGIGYAIDRDGLARAVQAGQLDHILFPADPAAAAPQILATLEDVFRRRPGGMVAGPTFRLGWGRPHSFVTADVGVVLELPSGAVAILGRLRIALPHPEAPIIDLRAGIAGYIDAADGLVEFTGDLAGSRLLLSPIDGGLVLRMKAGESFVLSAGGFHPRFPVPERFPVPKRLSIAIADSPFLKIIFTGYFAITPGTVQAGASLTADIGTGGTGVRGRLGFDALVRWEPSFGVMLDLYGAFDLRVAGASLCAVDIRVRVEGPTPCWHAAGRASVSFLFFDVSFGFDEHWGCTHEVTAPPPPDVARLLEQAAADRRNWAPLLPPEGGSLVTLAADDRLLHPVGRVRFAQRVVPLGVPITRFGPGRLPEARAFDVTVAFIGGSGTAVPVRDDFARADFFDLPDEAKLTEPAFEKLRSGAELAPPASAPGAPAQKAKVCYETKWADDPEPRPRWLVTDQAMAVALAHSAVARSAVHAERTRYAAPPAPSRLKAQSYAIVKAGTLTEEGALPRTATLTEAKAAIAFRSELSTVPAYEVRT
ncbi:DUF6603 domain-containing protein [Spirillospora sp. CA-128828]|uniref:DUF6603 domain-containing protein n=1 Tax=Spirillospora sp. CA-128828 TaxID=3240033 RepID=UPI003D8E6483